MRDELTEAQAKALKRIERSKEKQEAAFPRLTDYL
jgi:hypothetical protein